MNPLLVVNRQSLKRTRIIADRTDSIMSGIVKAAMIAELKDKLNKGIAHFIFIKKNIL